MSNSAFGDRTVLETAVPLKVPLCIYIDVTNHCNFRCSFCPTGEHLQKSISSNEGSMSFALFEKVANDIKQMVGNAGQKIKQINLFHMGEALLHKRVFDMIHVLHSANVSDRIVISTNGSLVNNERAFKGLCDSGLGVLSFSMYGTTNADYKLVNKKFSFDQILDNARSFKRYRDTRGLASPKIVFKYFEETEELRQMVPMLEAQCCDVVAFEKPFNWNSAYSKATNRVIEATINPSVKYCASPWFVMSVGNDGSVLACCSDWSWGTKYGDVKTETLESIWRGELLQKFKSQIADGRQAENEACNGCTYYVQNTPPESNLDRLIDTNRERALAKP